MKIKVAFSLLFCFLLFSAEAQRWHFGCCPSHSPLWNRDGGFWGQKPPETNPHVWYNLGRDAMDNHNYELAITDYTKAINLDSTFEEAYNYRGLARCAFEDYYDAIRDLDAAIKLNPKDASAYNSRGAIYEELNILLVAINDYKNAIKFDPYNKHYKENLTNALDKQNAH